MGRKESNQTNTQDPNCRSGMSSRFVIISLGKRELVMPSRCHVIAVSVMCIFLMVQGVGLHCVIVGFADPEGGGGAGGPDPPEIGFPSNNGPDPLKNYEARKPAFNVGPSSSYETPFK